MPGLVSSDSQYEQPPLISSKTIKVNVILLYKSLPTISFMVLNNFMMNIQLFYTKYLDSKTLDPTQSRQIYLDKSTAVGFSNVIANAFLYNIYVCLNQGFMIRISSYLGKNDNNKIIKTIWQTIILLIFVMVFQLAVILNIDQMCYKLGMSQSVIQYIQEYIFYCYLSSIFYGLFDMLRQYQLVYNHLYASLYISVISMILQILIGYLLLKYDIIGLGITLLITQIINFSLLLIYSKYKNIIGFKLISQPFKNICSYYFYLFKMFIITYADFLCYEVLAMIAAVLGQTQLNAHIAITQYYAILCYISLGLSALVSNEISYKFAQKRNIRRIKPLIYRLIVFMPLIIAIQLALLLALQNQWPYLYTDGQDRILAIKKVLPYTCILLFFDQYALISMGILKAIRKENTALFIYVFWYYFYAIPGCILVVKYSSLELSGIWIIWGSSVVAISICQLIGIFTTNLNKQYERKSSDNSNNNDEIILSISEQQNISDHHPQSKHQEQEHLLKL